MARTVRQIRRKGKRQPMAPIALTTVPEVDTRIALIQALIPLAWKPSMASYSANS